MEIKHFFAWPRRWPLSEPKVNGSNRVLYDIVKNHITDNGKNWIDPMCGKCKLAEFRNDIAKNRTAQTHLDALEFLKNLPSNSFAGVIYDPPYNDRQGKKYTRFYVSQSNLKYYTQIKREIVRIVQPAGKIIHLNWNSNRFPGPTEITHIYLFSHGSDRYDTIITIMKKLQTLF